MREYSSYTWWLKEQVAARSDAHGNVEPAYDFIYLDGAKNKEIAIAETEMPGPHGDAR